MSKKNVLRHKFVNSIFVRLSSYQLHGMFKYPYRVDKFENWEIEVEQFSNKFGKNPPRKQSLDEHYRPKLQTSRTTVYLLSAEALDSKGGDVDPNQKVK